jgi:N-acetylmuramoyl-L-alanine amidase
LLGLGFGMPAEENGTFGPLTEGAVRLFQEQRGLWVDGVVGRQSWNALVEAGWSLGSRLLYYRRPMLRGDDIAALQRQLGALGFDAGRIDGIFGPETQRALEDFQLNAGLPVDGICGPSTLQTLGRISTRADAGDVVTDVRERARLRDAPRTLKGQRIVIGEAGGLGALVESVRRAVVRLGATPITLHDPDESAQAQRANASAGDVYVGLRLDPTVEGCRVAYFLGHNGYRSEGGFRLATTAQDTICCLLKVEALGCRGMRIPILRETRMPAVLVELGPASVVVERGAAVGQALGSALSVWAATPYCD